MSGPASSDHIKVKPAADDDDREAVEQRPYDLQGYPTVIAKMQRLRYEQGFQIEGQVAGIRHLGRRCIEQNRFQQSRCQRPVAAHERREMMRAAEWRSWKGDKCHLHAGGSLGCI